MTSTVNLLRPLIGFAWHLGLFLVFAVGILVIQLMTGAADFWYWPVLGWGLGVFFHATGLLFKLLTLATGGGILGSPFRPAIAFLRHLVAFIGVGLFLFAANWLSGSRLWAPVPMTYWGIGLLVHGVVAGLQTLKRLAFRL